MGIMNIHECPENAVSLVFRHTLLCNTFLSVQFSELDDISQTGQSRLTLWGRDKMAAISQTTFSNAYSWKKNVWISIKISLEFVLRFPISTIPALVQIMAWRRPGGKPLSEPMMVSLLTHICVTLPKWVNSLQRLVKITQNAYFNLTHIHFNVVQDADVQEANLTHNSINIEDITA